MAHHKRSPAAAAAGNPVTDSSHSAVVSPRAKSPQVVTKALLDMYEQMYDALGPRGWWPANSAEEVILGAILVQNVSWRNTEVALERLRDAHLLRFDALHTATAEAIEACVKSTRFYRSKAKKLQAFARHLAEHHGGEVESLIAQPLETLRAELLSIYGIGRETADDIVLYAAGLPSFVVDAYTKRIFYRLGWTKEDADYELLRSWFMDHLPAEPELFNEYHALIDAVGHRFCHSRKPDCALCPLRAGCQAASTDALIQV